MTPESGGVNKTMKNLLKQFHIDLSPLNLSDDDCYYMADIRVSDCKKGKVFKINSANFEGDLYLYRLIRGRLAESESENQFCNSFDDLLFLTDKLRFARSIHRDGSFSMTSFNDNGKLIKRVEKNCGTLYAH